MEQLELVKRKIERTEDMQSVVKTMKALAAVNIREYEDSVRALGDYAHTIEQALHVLLINQPQSVDFSVSGKSDRMVAVVFGSEQGMVGQFNDVITNHVIWAMDKYGIPQGRRFIVALGDRVTDKLRERDMEIHARLEIVGSISMVRMMIEEAIETINVLRAEQDVSLILLFHNRPVSGSSYKANMVRMFPIDLHWLSELRERTWPSRMLPYASGQWHRLFARMVREYFFFSLYRAFIESLASENASRLASMEHAEKNIEERLQELQTRYHHQRQTAITAELLDIVAGFEALTGK